MPVRVLGLDPGTHVVGYGVIETEGSQIRFLSGGVWRAPRGAALSERLSFLADELAALLEHARPEAAAVEDVFVKLDPRAALTIGHGRGALLAVLGHAKVPVFDYAPATVKKAITGNGRADKTRVARMVGVLLGLAHPPEPLDATDALATAITHSMRARTQPLANQ